MTQRQPLGLTRTAVITAPYDEDYIAKNYSESGTVLPFYDNSTRGAGSVYSSVHDLIRFGMFHLKNNLTDKEQILSDKTIDEMQNTVDPVSTYTLSWDVTTKYGYRIVRHGGGAWGARTSLQFIPSENIAVCVLCNGWSKSSPDWNYTSNL